MRAERFYGTTVLAVSAVVLIAHVLGATALKGVLWGSHFYGFYPPWLLVSALAATVAVALGVDALLRGAPSGRDASGRAESGHERVWIPLACAAVGLALFWMFRIRHSLLGDENPLSRNLALGQKTHARQPLSLLLHHEVYGWTRHLFEAPGRPPADVAFDTVALNSVVAGALFVPVAIALARELVRRPDAGGLPPYRRAIAAASAALLLSQGYMQLFFGYVENYTWFALAMALFLWTGLLYLRGRAPMILASLAAVAAIGLNFSGIVLLPALAMLAVWGLWRRETRAGAIRDVIASALIMIGLQLGLAALGGFSVHEGFRYMWDLVARGEATDHSLTYLLSGAHMRDLFSFQVLMGPFAGFLFLPAVLHRVLTGERRDARLGFVVLAALPAFVASVAYGDSIQGLPRDWDLFAPFAPLYAAAAVYCIASTSMNATVTRRVLALATVVSLFHTASWIGINTSTTRSLERYSRLPLGRGRPEMTVGYWYLTHGRKDLAEDWFRRSVAIYRWNNTAQYQLGLFAMDDGRFEEAADRFAVAVESRPDKSNYRFSLVDALVMAGHPDRAAGELERLIDVEPRRADYWTCYGIVLMGLGRAADARAALQLASTIVPDDPRVAKLMAEVGAPGAYARAVREDWDALVVK